MKVLIIGNNKINSNVYEYLTKNGIEAVVISDVFRLRSVTGETGNFKAGLDITADYIILTEQPLAESIKIDGLSVFPLCGHKVQDIPADAAATEPVVFLLDYFCESPKAATIGALNNATVFARNKRRVFYLAKFIRTAGSGIEALYREAREAGVTFIKYEDLQITSDIDKEEFSIAVSDGEIDLKIITKTIYADGRQDAGESFLYAVKILGLTVNGNGLLTEDSFFLTPALTSRRGVYHITRDLAAERLNEGLDFICTHIKSGIGNQPNPDAPSFGIVVIDGNKCIFCYNCYRVCPHAALKPDPGNSQMQCLSAACFGCGTCAGLCPANAIKLENEKAGSENHTHSLLVICCENSGGTSIENTDTIDVLTVPCGGFIEEGKLSDKLVAYDKIIAVVCPDEACRHFNGNKHACGHINRLRDMMEAAGLSAESVRIIKASHAMPGVLREELNDSCRTKRN